MSFVDRLLAEFPASVDPGDLEAYGKDWTRVFDPRPSIIVFPESTEQVVKLVKICAAEGAAIVPSGGRTGLSGGAVASSGEVVVSLSRMRRMDPVDRLAQTVRVQAGAVTEAVHEHCKPLGLTWPVDFASKGSSQVGGNIATNAGGVRVIRYGLTRHWVLGLQVVTAAGEVLELGGALEKNQTGLDLRQLFIGSEGTLGIVTEATLKLTRLPGDADVFFFALDDIPAVLSLFQHARERGFVINAFEVLGNNCLEAVKVHRGLGSPFATTAPYYVLMEVERPTPEDWLESLTVKDGVMASNPKEARDLWQLREGISESLSARHMVNKHDISLPISRLRGFIDELQAKMKETYHAMELFFFGHIGDGNLHLNVRKPEDWTKEKFLEELKPVDKAVFELVQKHGGSISAEHGIGLLKKHALAYSRTPAEIQLMRAVKKALDPKNLLNPGKIFD